MDPQNSSSKYKNPLLGVEIVGDGLDASLNRTNASLAQRNSSIRPRSSTLIHKNSSLFTGKKERLQALKVTPYPPGDAQTELTRSKSLRFQVGNLVFSGMVERVMTAATAGFFVLVYLDFAFQSLIPFYPILFLSLALVLLFALHESIKLCVIGCVSVM